MRPEGEYLDANQLIVTINQWLQDTLNGWGVPEQWIIYTKLIIMLTVVVAMVYGLQLLARAILRFVFRRISIITNLHFFAYTTENKLPHYLALVIPYSFVRGVIPIVFMSFPTFINPLIKLTDIYMVFMIIWTVMAIIRSFGDVLQEKPAFRDKPIRSYTQVVQIIFYIFGAVAIYCVITGKSPTAFFAAMGAASAIFMLVFKDTIMGFVSSIQLSSNDMLKNGDWITMSKYGADGDVEEINLTTVKVRNFDKTITTIPTYAFISDSFQNWRGMQESGGRRLKRALYIKQNTIRFMTEQELNNLKKISLLTEYIETKQTKLNKQSKNALGDGLYLLTNNDLFVEYAKSYLQNHPDIKKDGIIMVRQLAPTVGGLPIELYTFTDTTVLVEYERISAEIMNHLISVVKYFDLNIFEDSSNTDDFNVYLKENSIRNSR